MSDDYEYCSDEFDPEIVDDNKSLAEFLGWHHRETGPVKRCYWKCSVDGTPWEKGTWTPICAAEYLEFHSSWDWLMMAINKIEFLGYDFIIARKGIQIWFHRIGQNDMTDLIINEDFQKEYTGEIKLEAAHQVCVSFVKYWNKRNEQVNG
jgi:hypothetical protein